MVEYKDVIFLGPESFEKSIAHLAGEQHHFIELQKLETLLYSEFDLKTMYEELIKYVNKEFPEKTAKSISLKELQKIDEFVKSLTLNKITKIEQYIVRAFVVGNIIEERQGSITSIIKPIEMNLNRLPETIKNAVKEYRLTPRQIEAVNVSLSHSGQHLTSATNATINRVQSLTTDNIIKGGTRKELANLLREEFTSKDKEINRNWNRVAINEISYAYNNGYLATMKPGQWVIGVSMPDRCDSCGALIDGKVYYFSNVTNQDMKHDDLDPQSKEYSRRAWLSENTVWLYKDNYGRSAAKRKRTEEGLKDRERHEMNVPACPLHVHCRCVWSRFNPDYQYVEKGGIVKMKAMNEKEWKKFYDTKIQPMKEKLKEYGII
jgi:hypothetical protein